MFGLGMQELVVVGVIALLLFGKQLPEVAKTLGKKYADFRKTLADIQSQMNLSDIYSSTPSSSSYSGTYTSKASHEYDDYEEATAPRFEPPPGEPAAAVPAEAPAPAAAETAAAPAAPVASDTASQAG